MNDSELANDRTLLAWLRTGIALFGLGFVVAKVSLIVDPGSGGTGALFVNGKKVGQGRINATVPMIYSADETCDVGCDTGTPVSDDYASATSQFTGTVNWVELHAGDDNHDLLITPEEFMRVATTFQ